MFILSRIIFFSVVRVFTSCMVSTRLKTSPVSPATSLSQFSIILVSKSFSSIWRWCWSSRTVNCRLTSWSSMNLCRSSFESYPRLSTASSVALRSSRSPDSDNIILRYWRSGDTSEAGTTSFNSDEWATDAFECGVSYSFYYSLSPSPSCCVWGPSGSLT